MEALECKESSETEKECAGESTSVVAMESEKECEKSTTQSKSLEKGECGKKSSLSGSRRRLILDLEEGEKATMVKKYGDGEFHLVVSVALREYTSKVKAFLAHIATNKDRLNGEPAHYNSFIEKYHLFIDLKVKYPDRLLIPTTEIEWVWYTHLLRPKFYLAFCERKYGGKIVPHSLDDFLLGLERPELLQETAVLFESEYHEPFFFPASLPVLSSKEEKEIKFLETADLYNDWSWWDTLQSQLGYGTKEFEDKSEKGYYDYLLSVYETGTRLGPPIHIDLFWHTHIIHPQLYHDDCMKMFGEVIFHTPLGTVGKWNEFPSHLTRDRDQKKKIVDKKCVDEKEVPSIFK